jgi:hypothetical protein
MIERARLRMNTATQENPTAEYAAANRDINCSIETLAALWHKSSHWEELMCKCWAGRQCRVQATERNPELNAAKSCQKLFDLPPYLLTAAASSHRTRRNTGAFARVSPLWDDAEGESEKIICGNVHFHSKEYQKHYTPGLATTDDP